MKTVKVEIQGHATVEVMDGETDEEARVRAEEALEGAAIPYWQGDHRYVITFWGEK